MIPIAEKIGSIHIMANNNHWNCKAPAMYQAFHEPASPKFVCTCIIYILCLYVLMLFEANTTMIYKETETLLVGMDGCGYKTSGGQHYHD